MKRGTKVSWLIKGEGFSEEFRGHGEVITDELDGKVLVSVHDFKSEPFQGFHPVICCTVTWLTIEN